MSLVAWVVTYLLNIFFWVWVVRWGGAEWLEGTFASGFLIHIFAPRWSSEGIKLFALGMIVVTTVLFIIGIFWPEFRLV